MKKKKRIGLEPVRQQILDLAFGSGTCNNRYEL